MKVPSFSSLGPVQYFLVAVGAGLGIAAVTNNAPLSVVREAFTGAPRRRIAEPLARSVAAVQMLAGATAAAGAGAAARADIGSVLGTVVGHAQPGLRTGDPSLVRITGTLTLKRPAAAAFAVWQAAYGRPIPCTSGWRSYESQAESHRKDPQRFISPDRSWHVKGLAVDVDLAAAGAGAARKGDPAYDRLVRTAEAAGWCLSAYTTSRGISEPWHFSYGGCG